MSELSYTVLKCFCSLLTIAAGVASVWFYAWVCNPGITSGTVWFVGWIFGVLCSAQTDWDETLDKAGINKRGRWY